MSATKFFSFSDPYKISGKQSSLFQLNSASIAKKYISKKWLYPNSLAIQRSIKKGLPDLF